MSTNMNGGVAASAEAMVAKAADAILGQCSSFIESLPDDAYVVDSKTLKGGTCGKHVRHILDHYSAIFVGVDTGEPIMYDRRERHVAMETSRAAAVATIADLRGRLAPKNCPKLNEPVSVVVPSITAACAVRCAARFTRNPGARPAASSTASRRSLGLGFLSPLMVMVTTPVERSTSE